MDKVFFRTAAAVDLGTTNIEARLVLCRGDGIGASVRTKDSAGSSFRTAKDDAGSSSRTAKDGENSAEPVLLAQISEKNCLAEYGADVLSRVQYCTGDSDALRRLSEALRTQIGVIVDKLINLASSGLKTPENSLTADLAEMAGTGDGEPVIQVERIVAAGNPIMEHFLAGIPADSIAAYPFHPLAKFDDYPAGYGSEARETAEIAAPSWTKLSLFRNAAKIRGIPLYIMPCVSGYIGGDTTAGLLALESGLASGKTSGTHPLSPSENYIFMDIGTNGEMVLRMDGEYCTCSAPCGPAFEGAEVSVGRDGDRGYYGSQLIDILAQLLDAELIDETGRFQEDIDGIEMDDGSLLTQEDIRNLQLAIAAVSGGLDTMLTLRKADITRIDHLYIAGVFGGNLDPDSAAKVGLLPSELKSRIRTVGNSSLKGACLAASDPAYISKVLEIQRAADYIELSVEPLFTDKFYSHMTLEDNYGA